MTDPTPELLRVTVNLGPRGAAAMETIAALTGDSKTEAINKALQAYALLQQAQNAGGGTWIQDNAKALQTQVRFY